MSVPMFMKSHYESLGEDITKVLAEVDGLKAEIIQLRQGFTGKVDNNLQHESVDNYEPAIRKFGSPEKARLAIESQLAKAKIASGMNQLKIKENRRILSEFEKLFSISGIPTSELKWKRNKSERVDHKWFKEFKEEFDFSDPCSDCERNYAEAIRIIQKWEKEIADAETAEKRRIQNEEKDRQRTAILVSLAPKYGLPITATAVEVRDAMLASCKYLRLSYYLEANRNDWNDGYSSDARGLAKFEVDPDKEFDQQIYDEVSNIIDKEDVDGRYFRDSVWDYNSIRSLSYEDLLTDWSLMCDNFYIYDLREEY